MSRAFSAFHGDRALKQVSIDRLTQHWLAGRAVPWSKTSFGAPPQITSITGATIEGNGDAEYERQLGIPAGVARLHETLLEFCGQMLPTTSPDEAMRFEAADFARDYPLQWLSTIRVGADLQPVLPGFVAWLLRDFTAAGAWPLDAATRSAARELATLFDATLAGEPIAAVRWAAARRAAVLATDSAKDDADRAACTFMESVAWPAETSADEWPGAVQTLWYSLASLLQKPHWTADELQRQAALRRAFDEVRQQDGAPGMSLPELIESTPKLKAMMDEANTPAAQQRYAQVVEAAQPALLAMARRQFEALLQLTRQT